MYQEPLKFNRTKFDRSEILDVIKQVFGVKISLNYISHQKRSPFLPKSVIKTSATEAYGEKLKELFPDFDTQIFFT